MLMCDKAMHEIMKRAAQFYVDHENCWDKIVRITDNDWNNDRFGFNDTLVSYTFTWSDVAHLIFTEHQPSPKQITHPRPVTAYEIKRAYDEWTNEESEPEYDHIDFNFDYAMQIVTLKGN